MASLHGRGRLGGGGGFHASQTISGHSSGWTPVTGDDEVLALDDAWAALTGADANVTFIGAGNQVSFTGPSNGSYDQTVTGSGGTVILVRAHVALTGDNDLVFFDPSDDVLDLSAATAGAWSTLYASSGVVNLHGASLSVVGGGVTINGVSGANAVSLYQTNGVADVVHGDGVSVTLVNAQASVDGADDAIWFVGGSASTVTLNLSLGQYATVYGAGSVDLGGGAVNSVGGGVLIDFLAPGETAYLSYTQGVWDRVQGAPGTIALVDAQTVVYGGNQIVEFTSGDDDAASLYQTNGDWDSVYAYPHGFNDTNFGSLYVNSAQANIFGSLKNIHISGAGAAVSLYGDQYYAQDVVTGSNGTIIVNAGGYVRVAGGGDKIFVTADGSYASLALTGTNGVWDTVYEQNDSLSLDDAQASVIGGGNTIYAGHGSDAVSLYNTGGQADTFYEHAAVTFNGAAARLLRFRLLSLLWRRRQQRRHLVLPPGRFPELRRRLRPGYDHRIWLDGFADPLHEPIR